MCEIEMQIDYLDRRANKIESWLHGDADLTKEQRQVLKRDLAKVYQDMAAVLRAHVSKAKLSQGEGNE